MIEIEVDEDSIEPGGPMTADKLRTIANWLTTYDRLASTYFNLLYANGTIDEQMLQELQRVTQGKGMQDDLLRWADELEKESNG